MRRCATTGTAPLSWRLAFLALAIAGLAAAAAPTAQAGSAGSPERLDRAALKSAHAPGTTPVPTARVAERYGSSIHETIKKFPDLNAAILALDSAFFSRASGPDQNKAARLADGREVFVMSGCRNMYLCSSTGYVIACDFSHKQLALIEVESASPPQSYLILGSQEPTLRNLLLGQAAIAFAKAAPDPTASLLRGITVSQAASGDPGFFQSQPEIASAVQRVYSGSGSLIGANDYCSVRLGDGRLFMLIAAETSHAEGRVPHAIAYDKASKVAFVYRAEGQLGKEAWFGNPDAALRGVLSVAASGCTNLRAKMGLDPNGHETVASAPPAPAAVNSAPAPGCGAAFPNDPFPGKYVRNSADKLTLLVAADCSAPSVIYSGNVGNGLILKGIIRQGAIDERAQDGVVSGGGCWAYRFARSRSGSVLVTWATDLIPNGKPVAPNCEAIAGEYVPTR